MRTLSQSLCFTKCDNTWKVYKMRNEISQTKNIHIFHVKIFNKKSHYAPSCAYFPALKNNKHADSIKSWKMKFEWLILNRFLVAEEFEGRKKKQFSVLSLLMLNRMAFPPIEFDSIYRLAMFSLSFFIRRLVFMFVNKFLCESICNVKLTTDYLR